MDRTDPDHHSDLEADRKSRSERREDHVLIGNHIYLYTKDLYSLAISPSTHETNNTATLLEYLKHKKLSEMGRKIIQ